MVIVRFLFAGILLLVFVEKRFPENPPAAHTGGFGEPTCHTCHFDGDLNDGDGMLILNGLDAVDQDTDQEIEVVLRRPGIARAGFQLSARFADGDHAGSQAGNLIALDSTLSVVEEEGVQYIHQAHGGEWVEAEEIVWRFKWEPPAAGDSIVFHAAANASNGDDSPFGDAIYTYRKVVEGKSLE